MHSKGLCRWNREIRLLECLGNQPRKLQPSFSNGSAASFGLAGGMLSDAAASSAGLAALGGGAVVTGGLRIAGGTAAVASAFAAVTAVGAGDVLYMADSEASGMILFMLARFNLVDSLWKIST